MKFCKDCRNMKIVYYPMGLGNSCHDYTCQSKHVEGLRHSITGRWPLCEKVRPNYCGPDAKWFEPKED